MPSHWLSQLTYWLPAHQLLHFVFSYIVHAAGTVNYVKDDWSPITAEVDCLGSGDEDIDREGRYGLHTYTRFPTSAAYA